VRKTTIARSARRAYRQSFPMEMLIRNPQG
jgi:hypothetical protein